MNESEPIFANDEPDGSRLNTLGRIAIPTAAGCLSGWLSVWCLAQASDDWSLIILRWVPGTIFGLWTLAVAWMPRGIASRSRIRRSWRWCIGLLLGITASYAMAVEVAMRLGPWIEGVLIVERGGILSLAVSGLVGGAVGTGGLANLWSMIFPGVEKGAWRATLIVAGALLGTALATWDVKNAGSLLPFFVTWQGGMALALSSVDAVWRRSREGHPT